MPGKRSRRSLRSARRTSREQRNLRRQNRLFQINGFGKRQGARCQVEVLRRESIIKGQNMSETQNSKSSHASGGKVTSGRLFFLEASGGRILSVNPDGSDRKVIVTGCRIPDGVVVDAEAGHIYWTNMGVPNLNDGSIERADLDGQNRKTIIPEGGTFTPKQLHIDKKAGKLYWCDREGMRVMRSNLDGSKIETLVDTSEGDARPGDATKWCVGITVDPERGQIYWTQKGPDDAGQGRIFRANIEMAKGENATIRADMELLFGELHEPIE